MWTNLFTDCAFLFLLQFLAGALPQPSYADQQGSQPLLRRRGGSFSSVASGRLVEASSLDDSPEMTDCLLSAVNVDDCGSEVAGCIWCAEPVYGLCVTPTAAKRMNVMPFFTCSLGDESISEQ